MDFIKAIVTPPRPAAEDPAPARFSQNLLVGSAQHAFSVDNLAAAGVTAVLNLAPKACADVTAKYQARGIAYLALDAEDQPGYSLLELHLEAGMRFLHEVRAADGLALVHCFAGVNRSAALAIAFIVLSEGEPLDKVATRCFALRPWILTNATFREELCELAEKRGLGPQGTATGGTTIEAEAAEAAEDGVEDDAEVGMDVDAAPPASDGTASTTTTWYQLDDAPLGDGAFATVYRCVVPSSKHAVAAKVVSRKAKWVWIGGRSVRSGRAYESLKTERDALVQVGRHPRVVAMEGWVEEEERALLLLELACAPTRPPATNCTACRAQVRRLTRRIPCECVCVCLSGRAGTLRHLWRPSPTA